MTTAARGLARRSMDVILYRQQAKVLTRSLLRLQVDACAAPGGNGIFENREWAIELVVRRGAGRHPELASRGHPLLQSLGSRSRQIPAAEVTDGVMVEFAARHLRFVHKIDRHLSVG